MSESPAPARVCRFVPAWALVVLVATLVSLAVNVGPGVAALVDYATHGHTATVAGPSAPLVSTVAASGPVAPYVDGVPFHDAAGEPWCLPGAHLYDTERVGAGAGDGVVCRRAMTSDAGGDFR